MLRNMHNVSLFLHTQIQYDGVYFSWYFMYNLTLFYKMSTKISCNRVLHIFLNVLLYLIFKNLSKTGFSNNKKVK